MVIFKFIKMGDGIQISNKKNSVPTSIIMFLITKSIVPNK